MARNNLVFLKGDITGDIYFCREYELSGKIQPFIRLLLCTKATKNTPESKGIRVVAFGPLAELTYGYVQKGSRIAVEGFLRVRHRLKSKTSATPEYETIVEVVADDIDFIRNIDEAAGRQVFNDLLSRKQIDKKEDQPGVHASEDAS